MVRCVLVLSVVLLSVVLAQDPEELRAKYPIISNEPIPRPVHPPRPHPYPQPPQQPPHPQPPQQPPHPEPPQYPPQPQPEPPQPEAEPLCCPAYEFYNPCGSPCKNDLCPVSEGPNPYLACIQSCQPRCECIPGYKRANGLCVPETECPPLCPANETYVECGNRCSEACNSESKTCPADCLKGCFCLPGYKRKNGQCVAESECIEVPVCEGENEEYQPCAPRCGTDSCLSLGIPFISLQRCTAVCKPGCYCCKGFARNSEGVCVPDSLCPQTKPCSAKVCSGKNEYFSHCPRRDQSCSGAKVPNIASVQCVPGCDCLPNFLRNEHGECVPSSQCPKDVYVESVAVPVATQT